MVRALFYETSQGVECKTVPDNVVFNAETLDMVAVKQPSDLVFYLNQGYRMAKVEDWVLKIPDIGYWIVIETNDYPDLPLTRELRASWILKNKKLDWDLDIAKSEALKISAELIESKIKPLDAPFLKAMEKFVLTGDNLAAKLIIDKKEFIRSLRDPLKKLNPKTIMDVQDCLNLVREAISNHEV